MTVSSGTCSKCVFGLTMRTSSDRLEASRPEVVRVISFGNRTVALVGANKRLGCLTPPEPGQSLSFYALYLSLAGLATMRYDKLTFV